MNEKKDISIVGTEDGLVTGNETVSGEPVDVEFTDSSGVIRDQEMYLFAEKSEVQVIESDIHKLDIESSLVELYESLLIELNASGWRPPEDPGIRYYGSAGETIDTRFPGWSTPAGTIAIKTYRIIGILQTIIWLHDISEKLV